MYLVFLYIIVKMHVLDQCVTDLRLLITRLPSDHVVSLEEYNVGRALVTTVDWLVLIKRILSVEDLEEQSLPGNTQISSFDLMSLSQWSCTCNSLSHVSTFYQIVIKQLTTT